MKSIIPILFLIGCFNHLEAQITTPIIKANFGVDADLNANYFNNLVQTGNDDWFNNSATDTVGKGVIDTTGAAALIAQYASNPGSRNLPFYRSMAYPPYTVINHRMLIDAVYIRDYHGTDSTIFASGASKNGMSPEDWSCPVAQSVPDKNEILDMMVHVRRSGPNTTDSLWMFGGLSIENTTGDRYFDFEMYQTDIYYDRSTLAFYGYGPDNGHTSWKFDASGNITTPGDIIFSADYGSSSLSYIEARIWVDSSALSITPTGFSWTGSFNGASSGSRFGYAGISPKTAGTFYVGTENSKSQWAGPFQLIRGDNSLVTSYIAGQYMEFGVNLTKLGLDPVTLLGSNACGMPFRRVLVKTRSSTSFTASLKDFLGPFDFFLAPRAKVAADTTALCGMAGPTEIKIINPVSTSVYTWHTPDGHIALYNGDTSIIADSEGTYIVTQQLQGGCSVYASDTVVLASNSNCFVLNNLLNNFTGSLSNNQSFLNWSVTGNPLIDHFEIQLSSDAVHFNTLGTVNSNSEDANIVNYNAAYYLNGFNNSFLYFKLKIYSSTGSNYSKVIKLFNGKRSFISITPNPVSDVMNVNLSTSFKGKILLEIYDLSGRLIRKINSCVEKGNNTLTVSDFQSWPIGIYSVKVSHDKNILLNKMILKK
jgi:hypothetical protein